MIRFVQKEYTEYDAMRALYKELEENWYRTHRMKVDIIDSSSLVPILKGNNVVIERFVINSPAFGKDKYRMYLKMGAKVKMPVNLKLAGFNYYHKSIGGLSFNLKGKIPFTDKLFSNNNNNKNNNNNGGGKEFGVFSGSLDNRVSIDKEVQETIGNVLLYDVKSRTAVFEFKRIEDAVKALNILPFGLNYKLYLLDS